VQNDPCSCGEMPRVDLLLGDCRTPPVPVSLSPRRGSRFRAPWRRPCVSLVVPETLLRLPVRPLYALSSSTTLGPSSTLDSAWVTRSVIARIAGVARSTITRLAAGAFAPPSRANVVAVLAIRLGRLSRPRSMH
jgi:hypothetical protein